MADCPACGDTGVDFDDNPCPTCTPQPSDEQPMPPNPPPPETEAGGSLSPVEITATAQPPLAHEPDILAKLETEVRKRGLVGEETIAKIVYLVMTSRLLDKQVSAGVKGHSSSGKSYTVSTVVKFFPPEAYIEMTAMSQKSLIYSKQEYSHRTLIVYEVVALREGVEDDLTSYFVRSLLSEGRIEYPVTVRDKEGGFTTKTIVKEGPTNMLFTTTKTKVHSENETRVLSLNTNDSREQTARVLLEIAKEHEIGEDDGLSLWRALQSYLQHHGERRITVPYATALAKKVPPVAVRMRRDFSSILSLIRSHALLHQATRERDQQGRVVATLDDYRQVRELISDVLAEGVGATVSGTVRETVDAVQKLEKPEGVMAREIADLLDLDKSNVSRRLRMAAEGGYLRNLEDKRGKPGRWVTCDPMPESVDLLPDTDDLLDDGCAVAVISQTEREARPCRSCGKPADRTSSMNKPWCTPCWDREAQEAAS